jgi:hypothetical protein
LIAGLLLAVINGKCHERTGSSVLRPILLLLREIRIREADENDHETGEIYACV